MGVLKLEMAELSRELAEARKASVAMAEKAASVKASRRNRPSTRR